MRVFKTIEKWRIWLHFKLDDTVRKGQRIVSFVYFRITVLKNPICRNKVTLCTMYMSSQIECKRQNTRLKLISVIPRETIPSTLQMLPPTFRWMNNLQEIILQNWRTAKLYWSRSNQAVVKAWKNCFIQHFSHVGVYIFYTKPTLANWHT